MPSLAASVRTIRKRLKLTQSELGQRIGVNLHTVSRYERGEIVPGRSALLHLLALSAGDERTAILRQLEISDREIEGLSSADLTEAATKLTDYFESPSAKSRPGLHEFRRLAFAILEQETDVDRALNGILQKWLHHAGNKKARKLFQNADTYLAIELAQVKPVKR